MGVGQPVVRDVQLDDLAVGHRPDAESPRLGVVDAGGVARQARIEPPCVTIRSVSPGWRAASSSTAATTRSPISS